MTGFLRMKILRLPEKSKLVTNQLNALGQRVIDFEAVVDGKWLKCYMSNVLYMPGIRRNLFSVTSAIDNDLEVHSSKSCCKFIRDGFVNARDVRVGNLYKMDIHVVKPETSHVNKTLYELFKGKTVHLNKLHDFGTDCYVHVPKIKRRKWDAKAKNGVFVGYSDDIDGYPIWMKHDNCILRSKNVVLRPETAGKTFCLLPDEVKLKCNSKTETDESVPEVTAELLGDHDNLSNRLRNRTD